jgi:signal transduction histidine kinase
VKLHNYTLMYLSVALLAVIGVWAIIFYFNMLDEIYDSIDDGLDNSKLLIINRVNTDTTLFSKTEFIESNYAIRPIGPNLALLQKDFYFDSLMFMQNEKDFEPVRMLRTAFKAQNGNYYQLQVFSSMVEEDDLISDLVTALVWLYLILLASVLVVNNVLLRKIWKPFYASLGQLRSFRLGVNNTIAFPKESVKEFNDLNRAIEGLLERNIATYQSQKQFIENASHELQTPLAIAVNKLELLAERTPLPETRMNELTGVIESLERLIRINKTLLLLSRIENRQYPESDAIDIGKVVDKTTALLKDFTEFKQVTVISDASSCLVNMNRELADIMISNLIKNAINHNVPGGKVLLTVTPNQLRVANTGRNLQLPSEKIFKRFYKESDSPNSTGLGLAIVHSVADYYGFEVTYSYVDFMHVFDVNFSRTTI